MIKGTNAYCKVTNVTINENIAKISLLIFASKSTIPAKPFKLCVKDADTNQLYYPDNNVYWIDQVNNYTYDANNIDTKKHKEIIFTIDISNSNTASIKGNKWVRNCYIYLLDSEKDINAVPAWSSDLLNLISDEFEVPIIENISFETKNLATYYLPEDETELRGNIKTKFNLKYKSQKDFNYNNSNITAILNIRSISTDNILETKTIETTSISLYNEIETTAQYALGSRVVVQLLITNKNGEVLIDERKIYKPTKKWSNSYIKTKEGIKKILAFFVNTDSETEHEGEWL